MWQKLSLEAGFSRNYVKTIGYSHLADDNLQDKKEENSGKCANIPSNQRAIGLIRVGKKELYFQLMMVAFMKRNTVWKNRNFSL